MELRSPLSSKARVIIFVSLLILPASVSPLMLNWQTLTDFSDESTVSSLEEDSSIKELEDKTSLLEEIFSLDELPNKILLLDSFKEGLFCKES